MARDGSFEAAPDDASQLQAIGRHYKRSVAKINKRLGRYQLQSLTPLQIERFYGELLASGGKGGGPISAKSVRNVHVVLRKALSDAERLGLVPRNAAAPARPPASVRREFVTWSSDDLRQFLAAVKDHRPFVAFVLLATTGMRRGEVLGLRWSDVDFDGSQLAVANTLTTVGNDLVMGPPKTPQPPPRVPRPADLGGVAGASQASTRGTPRRRPAWKTEVDLVVRDELGRPIHPDSFSWQFGRIVRSLDVPRIRLHDLRHTYATLALKAGVHPKVVSERLGHATVGVTLDLYSHVVPSIARDAANLVASHIFDVEEADRGG